MELLHIGLGTYKIKTESDMQRAVSSALDVGYRCFDTASVYKNEHILSMVLHTELKKRGVDRSEIFVTTKISPRDQGYEEAALAIENSLRKMELLEWVDLFLIHWPGSAGIQPASPLNKVRRLGTWKALNYAKLNSHRGRIRNIGVSNYEVRHLQELSPISDCYVNQIEVHPLYHPKGIIDYCLSHGIKIQAYSSLGQGALLDNEVVCAVARRNGMKSSQVLLKWSLQHGYHVLPKSTDPSRIADNYVDSAADTDLSEEDMALLDALCVDASAGKCCWDPAVVA